MPVLVVELEVRGRDRGDEDVLVAPALERRFEIVEIGPELVLADIFDRPGADQRLRPRDALGDQRARARRMHDLQVLVGAGELDGVPRRGAEADRAVDLFEAVEPRPRIGHPVELAVLAVADHVEAGVGLLADHLVDGALHPRRECGLVVGLAQLLGVQHRDQIGRPRQAAGVGGEDAARAALHSDFSLCVRQDFQDADTSVSSGKQKRVGRTRSALDATP